MLSRFNIATKIFGLAVLLLCLTVGLAGFLLWEVTRLHREMQVIAQREVPLASSLADLNEYGLRRALAAARWFGALSISPPNQEVIAEASKTYEAFTEKLTAEFITARKLLEITVEGDRHREKLGEIRAMLAQIEAAYPMIAARQRQVFDLLRAGQQERVNDIINGLSDIQRTIQNQRAQVQDYIFDIVQDSAQTAAARQQQVFWLTIGVTISAVLLGLTMSAIITQRLVGPVRALIAGIKSVEHGDLSVELPVTSRDEVGTLTRSFNFFVSELRSKEEMKRTFGQYIDPRVLEQAILHPDAAGSEDGRRLMSVSFADLEGFTNIGEQLTASGLVNLLNYHFTLQAEAIQLQQGVVDKFVGDAVMAFWGPPFTPAEEHPLLACRAALAQLKALETLRAGLSELTGLRKNLPYVNLRIGISTGDVVVGNIGSESARSYTVIGDTVNLGQRLEQANKIYGTHILASEATCKGAGSAIVTREIDVLLVKGKSETARVFEVLGLKGEVPEATLRLCNRFAEALGAYRAQDWDRAETALRGCLELSPEDGPAQLFLERVQQLRAQPPGEQWNGVWRLELL